MNITDQIDWKENNMAQSSSKRSVSEINSEHLAMLNQGIIETANLTECLAVDFALLMQHVFDDFPQAAIHEMKRAEKEGISKRMIKAASLIEKYGSQDAFKKAATHLSDTVRGWACFMIGQKKDISLGQRLQAIAKFADDEHFGVREWAWLAIRPYLADQLEEAINILSTWTLSESERIRRFSCESIRPRGVWCTHIQALKDHPEKALPVLASLKSDSALYVQKSVGNWLNDASKTQPEWVNSLCSQWLDESPKPSTSYICKRALRSICSA